MCTLVPQVRCGTPGFLWGGVISHLVDAARSPTPYFLPGPVSPECHALIIRKRGPSRPGCGACLSSP